MTRQAWLVVGLVAWAGCKGGSGQGSSGGTTTGITDATSSGSAGASSGSSTGGSTGGLPEGWGQAGEQCCRNNLGCECFTTTVCLDGCLNDQACPYWCGVPHDTGSSMASSSSTTSGTSSASTGSSGTTGSGSTTGTTGGDTLSGDQAFAVATTQLVTVIDQGQFDTLEVAYADSASLQCDLNTNLGVSAVGRMCVVRISAAQGSAISAGTYPLGPFSVSQPFTLVACYQFYPDAGVDPTMAVGEGGSVVLTTAAPSHVAGSFAVVTALSTELPDGGFASADGGSLSGTFDVRNPCP